MNFILLEICSYSFPLRHIQNYYVHFKNVKLICLKSIGADISEVIHWRKSGEINWI